MKLTSDSRLRVHHRHRVPWLLVPIAVLVAGAVQADTLYVPAHYDTIQDAIDAAAPGDQIVVSPGTYVESIDFAGKAILVRSATGPYDTLITSDSNRDQGVVNFNGGEGQAAVLDGFTIMPIAATNRHNVCVLVTNGSSPTVRNCVFTPEPITSSPVGFNFTGMWNRDSSSPTLVNCVVDGTGVFFPHVQIGIFSQDSSPTLINCTVAGCKGTSGYGGMCSTGTSRASVSNSIFWNNGPLQIGDTTGALTTVEYSDIQYGWPGVGNIDADPRFVNAALGDYRLRAFSRCIDAGDAAAIDGLATFDLLGQPRYFDDVGIHDWGVSSNHAFVDMGAMERVSHTPSSVVIPSDLPQIQNALDVMEDGGTISVGRGTYAEALDFRARTLLLKSLFGPSETFLVGDGPGTPIVRIEGAITRDMIGAAMPPAVARIEGFTLTGADNRDAGEGLGGGLLVARTYAGVKNCVFETNGADRGGGAFVLCAHVTFDDCAFKTNAAEYGAGLEVEAGYITATGCAFNENVAAKEGGAIQSGAMSTLVLGDSAFKGNSAVTGGAIHITDLSEATLRTATFTLNQADYGGAMTVSNLSKLDLADAVFDGNQAEDGGAIHLDGGEHMIARCDFASNLATFGSGMYIAAADAYVANSRFVGNEATVGGALYLYDQARSVVTSSLFSGNNAEGYGGAIFGAGNVDTAVFASTFSGNTAYEGGAVYVRDELSETLITNSVLWGNDDWIGEGEIAGIGPMIVTYTDVQGGYPGIGNGYLDPLFVDADGLDDIVGTIDDDMRIRSASLCINTGENTMLPPDSADLDNDGNVSEPVPFDLDGHPRIEIARVDMGAFEFPDCPNDANRDGIVNVTDLLNLLGEWGCAGICRSDVSFDGAVDVTDLLDVLAAWGPCRTNDDRADAIRIHDGNTPFSTIGATTDGPPLPAGCDEGWGLSFHNDIWYRYVPPASGTLTVSTCSQADYDTRLAAYLGEGTLTLIACNDDGPGCTGFTSLMDVPVTSGQVVLLRVGAYGSNHGSGTLTLTLSP